MSERSGVQYTSSTKKKTTFLLCCNHEPVRLPPNNNKPRCDYHRFTARVAINNKISVGFGIIFIGCLRNARTSPTYTNLHTTLTDITYRHYLHTPLLTYGFFSIQKPVAYLHLLTYYGFSAFKNQSLTYIYLPTMVFQHSKTSHILLYPLIHISYGSLVTLRLWAKPI